MNSGARQISSGETYESFEKYVEKIDEESSRPLLLPTPIQLFSTRFLSIRRQRLIGIAFLVAFNSYFVIKFMIGSVVAPSFPTAFVSLEDFNIERFSDLGDSEKKALFDDFYLSHNKHYSTVEEISYRFRIFSENLAKIDELNAHIVQPWGADFHISKFADLTDEEFKNLTSLHVDYSEKLKEILHLSTEEKQNIGFSPSFELNLETEHNNLQLIPAFDWRTKGAVTEVKDQGNCGASWAFSAAGNIEGVLFLNSETTLPHSSLSVQQFISCAPTADGCSQGMLSDAFAYAHRSSIEGENAFPYVSGKSGEKGRCSIFGSGLAKINGWTLCTSNSAKTLQSTLKSVGPISVAIDASQLQFYHTGILSCSSVNALNHGLLLVGYGQEQGNSYWILKNSWGSSWGMDGYLYVSIENDCGVTRMPMTAFFSKQEASSF